MSDSPQAQFLTECGWDGPLRIDVDGADGATAERHQPFVVIGRGTRSDLTVAQQEVSRRHAYLQVIAGRVFCADLHSRTGTHWGDSPRPWGWVARGRDVRVGSARLRPVYPGPEPEGFDPRDDDLPISRAFGLPAVDATLDLVDGWVGVSSWRISRGLVFVGRSPLCKVQLPGRGLAPFHFSLVTTPGGLWVVDLLDPAGTSLNGAPVRCARLDDGDELRAGPFRWVLRRGPSTRLSGSSSPPSRQLRPTTTTVMVPRPDPSTPAVTAGYAGVGHDHLPDPTAADLLHKLGQGQQHLADQFQQAILVMFRMHQDQMGVIRDELEGLRQSVQGRPAASGGLPTSLPQTPPDPPPARDLTDPASMPLVPTPPLTSSCGDPEDVHAEIARRLAALNNEPPGRWQKLLNTLKGAGRRESMS